jgi:hypothetical protein
MHTPYVCEGNGTECAIGVCDPATGTCRPAVDDDCLYRKRSVDDRNAHHDSHRWVGRAVLYALGIALVIAIAVCCCVSAVRSALAAAGPYVRATHTLPYQAAHTHHHTGYALAAIPAANGWQDALKRQ